jgi:hypothetical protein
MGLFRVRWTGSSAVTIVGLRDEESLISLFTITCFWYGFITYTTHSSYHPKNGYFFVPSFPLTGDYNSNESSYSARFTSFS